MFVCFILLILMCFFLYLYLHLFCFCLFHLILIVAEIQLASDSYQINPWPVFCSANTSSKIEVFFANVQ